MVFDNGKLGFIDIEQKSEGMLPLYTGLQNPDFGKVAEAIGFWGRTVSKSDELEEPVITWLNQPGLDNFLLIEGGLIRVARGYEASGIIYAQNPVTLDFSQPATGAPRIGRQWHPQNP